VKRKLAALLACICFSTMSYADPLWQIEIEEIMRIAIQAVHDKYPELPLHDLAVETGIVVSCVGHKVSNHDQTGPPRQFECQAQLSVSPQSTVTEKRYKDEKGNCRLVLSREPITVRVFENGTTRVGGRGAVKEADQLINCPEDLAEFRASPHHKPSGKQPAAALSGASESRRQLSR
jgi:hypothetical protein